MPSPFPGMDPYLEKPSVFAGLHGRLITYLEDAIQPQLPPPYFAKSGQRVWVELADTRREPDVSVVAPSTWHPKSQERGGTAIAEEVTVEPVIVTVDELWSGEFRETFLDIYTVDQGEHRLVTSIEVLSPTNKSPGEQSSGMYRKKQGEFLGSKLNLVEIDLLRAGQHVTSVPRKEMLKRCKKWDYHVCVHQFDKPRDFFVYPILLPQRLPTIFIPLLPGNKPIAIDLQATFDRCYDAGPYRREVDYSQNPPPPSLEPERMAWLKSILSAKKSAT
jgi:hypothetical protein